MKLRFIQREKTKVLQQRHLKRWIDVPIVQDKKKSGTLAIQLARAYTKEKSEYYGKRKLKYAKPNQRQYQHFVNAAEIYKNHKLKSFRTFFQAQIKGLQWVDNGRGTFPSPSQLGNQGAEDRLLEYLQNKKKIRVLVTEKEKQTSLHDNEIYYFRTAKIKDGLATLDETLYVKELQEIRLGEVKDYVDKYLKKLKRKGK